ncbi:MAG: MiaB/RimO family radical SAM methylthiotransferase [Novosphingobium sp.]|nr:MiaB/RimO family radical SAM methylthiotransferase [Novosphingobium sp.]MCP5400792.1 MiaB/RimO family radical SAM methylthiotransferase [Novosphingobium sp.]
MTVEVHSLGCRLNISESEELRGMLSSSRNLVVVNSCAVTSEAVRQTRQTIRKARRTNPDARLLVTGCAAEVERDMLAAMPEVDGLVANNAKLDPRAWNVPPAARPAPARYSRAFVQVQNGCDHSCTFCVIPQGRGPSRSRTILEVFADVARHCEAGIAEVVLTGVDLTSWGDDLPDRPRLGALATAILEGFPELRRLRLSSVDGAEVDLELFELLADHPRMMPHLHLSLQSGDDMILKRMKRRHSRRDAIELVTRLRERRPELGLGADMIAGFPTEDEEMHRNNVSIIGELGIVHGHIFPFSPRPGTPAARMPRVDPALVKARAAELRAQVAGERRRWLFAQIGRPLDVLAETDGTGHAENFAPVRLQKATKPGSIVTITPQQVVEGLLA